MRFIHLSDLHLGRPLNAQKFFSKEDHKKRLFEIEEAFYTLLKNTPKDVDFYVISGDVFDQDGLPTYMLKRFLKETQNAPVPVVMIAGNHDDFLDDPLWADKLNSGSLTLLNKTRPTVLIGDVQIDGQSTKDFDLKTIKSLPRQAQAKHRLLLIHGDVLNAKDRYFLTKVDAFKDLPYDYVGCGHIHLHQFLAPHIAYAGNLEPFDISETGPKGYILGDLDQKAFNFVASSKRQYHQVDIVCDADDDHGVIVAKINGLNLDDTTMVRIYLKGETASHAEPIEKLYQSLRNMFFSTEIKDQRTLGKDIQRLKKEYAGSLVEVLIDEADDEATLALALEALFAKGGPR